MIAGGGHNRSVSKAFNQEDGPAEAPILRRRAPLPAGVPNYVTPHGLEALRDELTALDAATPAAGNGPDAQAHAARGPDREPRIASAVVTPPPADRAEIRFGARVR